LRTLGWRLFPKRHVLLLLILEAAHQPTAKARDLRRIQRQVLLLGHADRDRVIVTREQRAAQTATAWAQSPDHASLFPSTYLSKFYAFLECLGQIDDQRPEVHPLFGEEVKGDLLTAEADLGSHQFHVKAVCFYEFPAGVGRFLAQVV
jgi:hypothetical protein